MNIQEIPDENKYGPPPDLLFGEIVHKVSMTGDSEAIVRHDELFRELESKVFSLAKNVRRDRNFESPELTLWQIYAKCVASAAKIDAAIDWAVTEIMASQGVLQKKIGETDEAALTESYRAHFTRTRAAERDAIAQKAVQVPILKKELAQIEEKEDTARDARMDLLTNVYKSNPPQPKFYHKKWGYKAVMAGIFIVEIPINFIAIRMLGEMVDVAIVPVTLVLSGLVALGSHHIGVSIAEKRWWRTAVISTTTFALCCVVIGLRMKAGGALALSMLNLIAVGFSSFFAYVRNFDMPYFRLESTETVEGINAVQKRAEIEKLEKGVPEELKAFDKELQDEAGQRAKSDIRKLHGAVSANGQELQRLAGYKIRVCTEFKHIYELGIAQCKGYAETARKLNNLPQIDWATLSIPTWECPNSDLDKNRKDGGGGNTNGLAMLALLAFLFLGLVGCSKPKQIGGAIIFDETEEGYTMPQSSEVAPVISNMMGIPRKGVTNDHFEVTLDVITDMSMSRNIKVVLNEGKGFWGNYVERLREMQDFHAGLIKGDTVLKDMPQKGLKQSYVQDCLCRTAVPLAGFDTSFVLVFSDMFENSDSVNFYEYRNHPERLYGVDFDLIAGKLDRMCPEMKDGSLRKVSITVVFMPSKENDPLFKAVKWFWVHYLVGKKGASLRFVPQLGNISVTARS
ncbi:MAG: hypothetical protein H6577_10065 [Lewinellaceae bacterium]|nr:hypothetical protein [Saprospiraceae bacterium]MCB9338462.1 hypothetical protein [Lewinellaceae bacterium]